MSSRRADMAARRNSRQFTGLATEHQPVEFIEMGLSAAAQDLGIGK